MRHFVRERALWLDLFKEGKIGLSSDDCWTISYWPGVSHMLQMVHRSAGNTKFLYDVNSIKMQCYTVSPQNIAAHISLKMLQRTSDHLLQTKDRRSTRSSLTVEPAYANKAAPKSK